MSLKCPLQEILSACWSFDLSERPSFTVLMDMLEKLPKLNRRLSHPGHFWKSAEWVSAVVENTCAAQKLLTGNSYALFCLPGVCQPFSSRVTVLFCFSSYWGIMQCNLHALQTDNFLLQHIHLPPPVDHLSGFVWFQKVSTNIIGKGPRWPKSD